MQIKIPELPIQIDVMNGAKKRKQDQIKFNLDKLQILHG